MTTKERLRHMKVTNFFYQDIIFGIKNMSLDNQKVRAGSANYANL